MAMPVPVTDNQEQTVQRVTVAIQQFLDKGGKLTEMARKIGYSHSALSQFMRGKYPSYQLAIAAETVLIRMGVLEPVKPEQVVLAHSDFIPTADALEVLGLCQQVWEEREIGVIVGPAGTGKTTALKEYCRLNPTTTAYFRADVSLSTAELLVELGRALGVDFTTGISLRSMMRSLVNRLTVVPRLIIVDEADLLLSGSGGVRKMELLRTLFDEAGNCALLLAGMPKLKVFLTRGPSLKDNLAQFYSRVAYMRLLSGLCEEDFDLICQRVKVTDAGRRELLLRATHKETGGLRRLMKVLAKADKLRALECAEAITQQHVREADGLGLNY